jgi:hypothetical protein
VRRLRDERIEIRGKQASDAVLAGQRLRGQVARPFDERQAARKRDADHAGVKAAVFDGRHESVRRVGMMGREAAGRDHESSMVRLHQAADAELLHDDKPVDRHVRDVGGRALEPVGRCPHL